MAVEASHFSFFPSHNNTTLLINADNSGFLKPNGAGSAMFPSSVNQMAPFPATFDDNCVTVPVFPFYQSVVNSDPISGKASINNTSDSCLTYNMNHPPPPTATATATRKRARDPSAEFENVYGASSHHLHHKAKFSSLSSLIDGDFISQIQQQQSEIDRFVAEHTQRVRIEMEERRRRQSRMLVAAIQDGITKKMKEKDDEILRIGKLNWLLQEKVQTLCVENQLWRELAQTNEATANSLRSNLEQVLAHDRDCAAVAADDAASSCGEAARDDNNDEEGECNRKGMCKKCGERESGVLLLPCRHLCLCTVCGSTLVGDCPVCNSAMNGSVHVNML
ncbi:BOI-related E3 ubiquitin-protein ligase 1 [Linum perenne]